MRKQLISIRARLSMGLILALLAVSFLPSYTPLAYAGNPTGTHGDNSSTQPPTGGPDDPSDGPTSKGSAQMRTPLLTTSSGDVGDGLWVKKNGARGIVLTPGSAAFWLNFARTTVLGYWLHR